MTLFVDKQRIHSKIPKTSEEILFQPAVMKIVNSPFYDFLSHRLFPTNKSDLTEYEKAQIIDGVQNTYQVLRFFEEKIYYKSSTMIPEIVESVFNVSSCTVSAAFLFIGVSSSEITLLKKALIQLNNKINKLSVEIEDIKNMIEWNSLNINLADIENSILTLQSLVSSLPYINENESEFTAKQFLNSYEVNYRSAGSILYSVMIKTDQGYSENLLKASQKFTQFYRNQVQEFMLSLTNLLVQAIQIEAIYINLKFEHEKASYFAKSLWEKRLVVLKEKMETIDLETKDQYKIQYQTDLDEFLMSRESLNNEQFSRVIYNFLSKKYDWRDWFVLVYAPVSGFKDHAVVTCQGTYRFRKFGRNIIISSVDKSEGVSAMSHIERNKQLIGSYTSWKSDSEYSKGWVSFIGKLIPNCNDADTRVSVAWGSNVWYMNTNLVVYKKNCVNDKSPCYNSFLFA